MTCMHDIPLDDPCPECHRQKDNRSVSQTADIKTLAKRVDMFSRPREKAIIMVAESELAAKDAEIKRLREAIRTHRDIKGDERCRLDDETLYAVLGEPVPEAILPPRDEFVHSCGVYWDQRKSTGCTHDAMPTLAQQQETIMRLREALEVLSDRKQWGDATRLWPNMPRWILTYWMTNDHPAEFARKALEGKA